MDAAQHRTPARIDGRCTLPSCAQTDRPRTPVPPTAAARLLSTASWRSAVDANRVMSCRAPGYRARREYRGPHRWEIDRRHGERQRILGAGHGPPRRRVRGARRVVFMHGLARSGAPAASGVRTVDGAPGNGGHFGGAPHMAAGAMAASVRRPLPHPAAEVGRMPVNRVRCASRHPRTGMGRVARTATGYQRRRAGKPPGLSGWGDAPSNLRRRAPPRAGFALLMHLCVSRR